LGIIEELRDMKLLPRIKLSSIINTHGTYIDAANVNNHATRGSLKMPADMDVDLKDLLERAKSLGASSMPIDEYDFAVWEKLLVNCCINPLTVLYKCKNGELESNQTALTHVHELVKELQRFTEWRFGSSHHTSIDSIMKLVLGAIRLTSQNYSSMYQDVLIFKRRCEIDYLNGFFTRLAEREALPYPLSVNNDIVNQIKFIIS
jgi:2-dehydropantoate 2-reductase